MATAQQLRLYRILCQRKAAGAPSPSYTELAEAMNLRSRASITALVRALEAEGLVRRLPYRHRTIEPVTDDDLRCAIHSALIELHQGRIDRARLLLTHAVEPATAAAA